ncbi:MAG TPA: DUF1616 domain-containing protein [Bacillota bacterium]|nr:DUF1616 domain-containing protein [Bacillota bacterium]
MTERSSDPATSKRVPKWALGLGLFLVLAAGFVAVSHTQAYKLATTHQPERFTELYFTHPDALPARAEPGSKLPVAFTLHNQESRDTTYNYRITFTDQGGTVTLVTHSLQLKTNQQRAITEDIVIPTGDTRGEVSVQLIHEDQSVHFWIERN